MVRFISIVMDREFPSLPLVMVLGLSRRSFPVVRFIAKRNQAEQLSSEFMVILSARQIAIDA